MKIGILTFHFACNYGAVLQCCALQTYLTSLGQDVRVIDYRPSSVDNGYRLFDPRRFWGKTPAKFLTKTKRELSLLPYRKERYDAFKRFARQKFKLSSLNEDYDLIIVGGDQVWNKKITGGFDRIYWGGLKAKHLVSYSASDDGSLTSSDLDMISGMISRFDAVSVRERRTAELLSAIRPVQTCADPVLLLGRKDWVRLSETSRMELPSKPYVLYYQVRPSKEGLSRAKNIAAQKGAELICLSARLEDENDREFIAAAPDDFLHLFLNAEAVVTTSYHGLAIALSAGCEVTEVLTEGNRTRIVALRGEDIASLVGTSKDFLKNQLI